MISHEIPMLSGEEEIKIAKQIKDNNSEIAKVN